MNTNDSTRDLCIALLHADTEEDVIQILKDVGYWEDTTMWRLYGDRSGNYATIGAQQSRPEAALVEKLINSVDARLMNECLRSGIDPTSASAPQSIRQAVARFFEDRDVDGDIGGKLQLWPSKKRSEESHNITIAATGGKRNPCLTIADRGEGQTPDRMPSTFLSIDRENKLRISFVQGKFNMGGTGALRFCGANSLQLIITRRNPAIVTAMNEDDSSSEYWGFTVVRRIHPSTAVGAVRNSMYTYLAPYNAQNRPEKGGVLRFLSDNLPLMPQYNEAYVRDSDYGSAIKLYNYDMKGFLSHVTQPDGLLFRLEPLLPEIALPISIHECRDYRGEKKRSFHTPLSGLTVRLEVGRGDNLEDGFPASVTFAVNGERMVAKVYAFKKGKAETYRTNEGIIFTINGQTHGYIPKTVFQRKAVGMGRLADSLLVVVDCSAISVVAREDLFMNSRDRLSSKEIRKAVESQLEEILRNHPGLKALRERRQNEEIADRLQDSKPLEDVLASILKSSPSLSSLFLPGNRLSNPFRRTRDAGKGEGKGGGDDAGKRPFVGKPHPTYFRFDKKRDGEELKRNCEHGRRCRLSFETDAENDYFSRTEVPGQYALSVVKGNVEANALSHSLTLHDGYAHWSIAVPDTIVIGEVISLQCRVTDETLADAFVNVATLTIKPQSKREGGNESKRRSKSGKGGGEGQQERPAGFQLPHIVRVTAEKYDAYKFDSYTACEIVQDQIEVDGEEQSSWTFRVNVDNRYLLTDVKATRADPKLAEAKFVYANVLIGLALIQANATADLEDDSGSRDLNKDEPPVEDVVKQTTKAIAPFMLPMIDSLGALSADDVNALAQAGDEE